MAPAANARRPRSSSRRRKIKEELEARQLNFKEVWQLQQELVREAAKPALMEAAQQLLQAAHYDAVVEERSLEQLCGFPACTRNIQVPERKRWAVNYATKEVLDAAELRSFCSPGCRQRSHRFRAQLQPEPPYLRPAAAVASTRAALSETSEAKEVPKVRPRAVVRFSRERQSYSVQYKDYDGGGALPDMPAVKERRLGNPCSTAL
ncbi:unnamed protein product [Effrenium voratum]|nr:unnamed protein product [Effrenium voratum]